MDTWQKEQYCYLTTTGRRSGKLHIIEIWFATPDGSSTFYLLAGSGEKADWVRNLKQNPSVQVKIGSENLNGQGRIIERAEEETLARKLIVKKYYERDEVQSSGWEATSLAIAIDLQQ